MILPSVVRSGRTPRPTLRAAGPDPERDHLVEDQQGARARSVYRAEERQEVGVRGADAAGALDRLDDDRREIALAAAQRRARRRPGRPTAAHDEAVDRAGTPGVPAITPSWVPW